MQDMTQAVNNSSAPDDFYKRALLYIKLEEWDKGERDLDKVIASEDYKRIAQVYAYRAICKMQQNKRQDACKDIEIAYNLTNDKELEDTLQKMWNRCGC